MHGWTGWTRLTLPLGALVLGACATPPEQLGSGSGSADGTSTTDQPPTTAPSTTTPGGDTMATLGGSGMETTPSTESADTTAGMTTDGETTMSVDPTSGSSSSGPPPECMGPGDCENNEDCVGGECVEACGGTWGMGSYNYCLNQYGQVASGSLCGGGVEHTCTVGGTPIEAATCMAQNCVTPCDCPSPPNTGDAVVACGPLTQGDATNDCFLDCSNGETCPEGMVCRMGTTETYCAQEVQPLALYGNCSNIDASCSEGQCVIENGHGACLLNGCANAMDCGSAPPGAANNPACDPVISPPSGPECHLPCGGNPDCPAGMVCYQSGVGDNLCMWPPL